MLVMFLGRPEQPFRTGLYFAPDVFFRQLLKIYNLSHVGRKNLVYFGPQTKKVLSLIMDFFLQTTFWPLGGAAP